LGAGVFTGGVGAGATDIARSSGGLMPRPFQELQVTSPVGRRR
jgi:hypothetical protein